MSERNFCERCGKRLRKNEFDVHICTPPQNAWIRLTDKEIEECWDGDLSPYQMQCIREIEAKLKEKNA